MSTRLHIREIFKRIPPQTYQRIVVAESDIEYYMHHDKALGVDAVIAYKEKHHLQNIVVINDDGEYIIIKIAK